MTMRVIGCWLAFMLTVALQSSAFTAEPAVVAEDPDFAIQGEYQGEISEAGVKRKAGVQVIALGKGKFRSVGFWGGLPGDGRETSDMLEWKGETTNGVTALEGKGFRARIEASSIIVEDKSEIVGKLARIVRRSPTLNAKPPRDAVVLFDGTSAESFVNGQITADKLLMPGTTTKASFQSGTLHVEFQIPFAPDVASRGNSGVYLQSRYEVQILDSIGFAPHNHECGGIPSVKAADVTMSFPPLSWQTYDVEFTAAQFRDGKKEKNSRMTVRHNGVVIHDNVEVPHVTTSAPLAEGPEPGPINFQEHGAQVRFRNIWFLPRAN